MREPPLTFSRCLRAMVFWLYVAMLFGPFLAIFILAFQTPLGGLSFPMHGVSLVWFSDLINPQQLSDFRPAVGRSLILGVLASVLTAFIAMLAGLAFRRGFPGATMLLYATIGSLVIPSVLVSVGLGLVFQRLKLPLAWWSSGLGAVLTWTLPFGVLLMISVLRRLDPVYEEAGRDLGATATQVFLWITLPFDRPGRGRCSAHELHPRLRRVSSDLRRRRRSQYAAARARGLHERAGLTRDLRTRNSDDPRVYRHHHDRPCRDDAGQPSQGGRTLTMHIRLISPITSDLRDPAYLLGLERMFDVRLSAVCLSQGPASIESEVDHLLAGPDTLRLALQAEAEGCDAIIVDCMLDPAVSACREAVDIPVFGPGEIALHAAAMLGHRFSIIAVMQRQASTYRTLARHCGLEARLASVRSLDIPVLALNDDSDRLESAMLAACEGAVSEDGADTVVLGCTALEGGAQRLMAGMKRKGYDVVVLEGLPLAVGQAAVFVRCGLGHAKRAYPAPTSLENGTDA